MSINPAHAGGKTDWEAIAQNRFQWVGFEGAPNTQIISVDKKLKDELTGVGLLLVRDQITINTQIKVFGNYSYRVPFKKGLLSFGLKAGFIQYTSKLSQLDTKDISDPSLDNNDFSTFLPNFGIGALYYRKKISLGFSIPQFVGNPIRKQGNSISEAKLQRLYILTGGYRIKLSEKISAKPNIIIRGATNLPIQFDLNTNIGWNEKYWLGTTYRSSGGIDFLSMIQFSENLRIGYSYDFEWRWNNAFRGGSHEFSVMYIFLRPENKIEEKPYDPRYF